MRKLAIAASFAAACGMFISATAVAQAPGSNAVGAAKNDILDAESFGKMVMIATLNQLNAGVTRGKEEKVNLPMTVSLADKGSGPGVQCVQICTVIGGVPVCVCI